MKKLYLTHTSAIMYWRAVRCGLAPMPAWQDDAFPMQPAVSSEEIARLASRLRVCLPRPIDIGYAQHKDHRKPGDFAMHLVDAPHQRWFLRASEGIYVAAPELCFFQMAATEPVLALAELAMELCGSYSLYRQDDRGFASARPLLTLQVLAGFVATQRGRRGAERARRALALAAAGSASPRETELFLLLTLPPRKGGYGMARPELAYEVALDENDRTLTNDRRYYGDLCWPDKRVIAEYDGEADHSSPEDVVRDKSRRSVLAAKGYKLIVYTKEDMVSDEQCDMRTAQLARALGIRLRACMSAEARAMRKRLRRHLFWVGHHELSAATAPYSLDA